MSEQHTLISCGWDDKQKAVDETEDYWRQNPTLNLQKCYKNVSTSTINWLQDPTHGCSCSSGDAQARSNSLCELNHSKLLTSWPPLTLSMILGKSLILSVPFLGPLLLKREQHHTRVHYGVTPASWGRVPWWNTEHHRDDGGAWSFSFRVFQILYSISI